MLWPQLSDNAAIWIFSNSTPLTKETEKIILEQTQAFLSSWSSHGASLQAEAVLLHQQILLIGNDNSLQQASGCSIDKLNHHILALDQAFNTNFMDRSKVVLKEKNDLYVLPLTKVNTFLAKSCKPDLLEVIQTHQNTLGGFRNDGIVPLEGSWLKKYLPQGVS